MPKRKASRAKGRAKQAPEEHAHKHKAGFETRAVHVGEDEVEQHRAVVPPIYHTSTFKLEEIGKAKGYEYSRSGNPTRTLLEEKMRSLESGRYALAFSSGMAAINGILATLNAGDTILCEENIYGGTYRLVTNIYPKYKIGIKWVDATDLDAVDKALDSTTKMLWIETPTNPLLKILDLRALANLAHSHDAQLVVDNTFASPFLQRPLEHGADTVVHSTTKYIGGHSDLVGGAVVTCNDQAFLDMSYYQNATGAVPSPYDCYLMCRSLKTLALRMRQHCFNAKRIAEFLAADPRVRKVYYPGLPDHPGHELAMKQMDDFGGIITIEPDGDIEVARAFCNELKYFSLAVSLGAVESLVAHPPTMTHATLPLAERLRLGIKENMIRFSVGVEDVNDLIEDLDQALTRAVGPRKR